MLTNNIFFYGIFILIFFLQDTLTASAAADDQSHPTDVLGVRTKATLESIKAIVGGRIRANASIIEMLNDTEINIKDRISQFYEIYEGSPLDLSNKSEEELNRDLPRLLAIANESTKNDISRSQITNLICSMIEGKTEYQGIKGCFFLIVHIQATIRTTKIKSIEEYYYYKKMGKILEKGDFSDAYAAIERGFDDNKTEQTISFEFKMSKSLVQRATQKLNQLLELIDSCITHSEVINSYYEEFNRIQTAANQHEETIEEKALKLRGSGFTWGAFVHEKKLFDLYWHRMQWQISMQALEKNMDKTAAEIKEIKTKQKSKSSESTATSNQKPDGTSQKLQKKESHPESSSDEDEDEEDGNEEDEKNEDKKSNSTHFTAVTISSISTITSSSSSSTFSSATLPPTTTIPSPKPTEWMAELKGRSRQVDFWYMLKAFKSSFSAKVEEGQKTAITFRGPNTKLITIICDTPHGAQLTKAWPAWRYNMIRGLIDSGVEF